MKSDIIKNSSDTGIAPANPTPESGTTSVNRHETGSDELKTDEDKFVELILKTDADTGLNRIDDDRANRPIHYDTLVLSGASIKGLVLLGALQYAYDNYLMKITTYIGTSSGAMICYLLAIGYTPIEIAVYICTFQLMEKLQEFNLVSMLNGAGATSFSGIQEQLEKMTINKIGRLLNMQQLKEEFGKRLVFATYNLTKNCAEYLSAETHPTIPCLTAIRMSCNLPLIFEHFKYNGCFYVDGGLTDNFAINVGDRIGTKIIGIYTDLLDKGDCNTMDMNVLEYIYKLICIPINHEISIKVKRASKRCDVFKLENDSNSFDFKMDSREKLEMFSCGYQQIKQQIQKKE
jgi:predicted acylesterase/phospholipase RssA